MRALKHRMAVIATGTAVVVAAAGCTTSVEEIPLPGGADLGDHPYTVKVRFPDAINLVPQASVRVNDVPVGRVKKVSLPDGQWNAEITLQVNGRVSLPANAFANLEQSSLLGEKYIRLAAPPGTQAQSPARLKDGDIIPVSRTSRNADTEEVFGALSLLLSGGGLPQLRTITRELNQTFGGRETEIKSALRNLDRLTSSLNTNRRTITNVIDGLSRLSSTVAARRTQVVTVLDDLSPGLKVLADQRGQFVTMLRALERMSKTVLRYIRRSKDDTIADLRDLAVIVRKLADSGRNLPKSLEVLLTYPFTDQAMKAIKGDYLNVFLTVTAADGSDCVIPPIPEDEAPQDQARNRALAAEEQVPPAGPQPVPCPAPAAPGAGGTGGGGAPQGGAPQVGAPQMGGAPRVGAPARQGARSSGGDQGGPPLPLPSIGD